MIPTDVLITIGAVLLVVCSIASYYIGYRHGNDEAKRWK